MSFSPVLVPLLCAAMNVASQHTSLQHLHRIFRIVSTTKTYTFRYGNEQLWRAVAAGLPVSRECEVAELLYSAGHVRGVRLAGSGEVRPADHVIVAVAPHVTERLLPAEMSHRRAFFRGLVKNSQCIPVVYMDRRLDERIVNYG
ncbi:MAG: FAD-dependent oxidoreductase [Proteobacteria bacterium]|nr:FAD-dependent oxidoreductase [Pseudomonadota bacterium]